MMSIYYRSNKKISDNFDAKELRCPCCNYTIVDSRLLIALEAIRRFVGKPITVLSGYRCPMHNSQPRVGGVTYSRHLTGMAADITWEGYLGVEPRQWSAGFKAAFKGVVEENHVFGIGWGLNFIHIDVDESRKLLTEWNYS